MFALPIAENEPNIGADVYAIGTPLDKKLSTTLTKGIISGYRIQDGQKLIQSDVQILPGNSGGPLLDVNGNIVGVAVSGYRIGAAPAGLNFFVPIADALRALKIER